MKSLQKRRAIFVAALLYVLTLVIRLHEISISVPKPDEVHWQWRSHVVYERLLHDDAVHATTHLGHPGIVPALIMGGGQILAEVYNETFALTSSDYQYIDLMTAARCANAVVSSLVVPFVYLAGMLLLGAQASFFAACLLLLDPLHIAASRMAHLDSVLTLLVTATYFFYVLSLTRESLRLKGLAAIFWGLSIATKPTAVSLLAVFFVTRYAWVTYQRYLSNGGSFKFSFKLSDFVRWSDFWFVIIAHITFACLYTRLWDHFSDYHNRLAIKSRLADIVYRVGHGLFPYRYLVVALLVIVLMLPYFFRKRVLLLQRFANAYLNISALIVAGVITLTFYPAVIENIVRFWCWVFGLSNEHHKAYGIDWEPQPYGYLSLYLSRLTDLDLFLIVLTFCILLYQIFGKRLVTPLAKAKVLQVLLLITTVVLWTVPLSFSAKQTFRYVLPVLPLLYLFSSYGVVTSIGFLKRKAAHSPLLKPAATSFSFLFSFLILGSQAYATVSYYPHYELCFSNVSGGLKQAQQRHMVLPSAGEKELVEFLVSQVKETKTKVTIGVMGEANALAYYVRFHHPELFPLINFVPLSRSPFSYPYILALGSMVEKLPDYLSGETAAFEKKYSYSFKGTELYSLYQVSQPSFEHGYQVPLHLASFATGKHSRYDVTMPVGKDSLNRGNLVFLVDPVRHSKGFPFFGFETPVTKGSYEITYTLGLPNDIAVDAALPPEKFVARIEFGSCQRIVQLAELNNQQLTDVTVNCDIAKDSKAQLRVYWFGNVPMILSGVNIKAAG